MGVLGEGVGGLEATIKIRGTNVTTIMAMIIVGVTHAEGVPAGVEASGVAWQPVAFLDTCLEIEAVMEVMDIVKDQDGVGEVVMVDTLEILVLEASQEALVRHLEAVEAQVVQEQPLDLEVHVADEVKNYQFSVMLSKKAKEKPN